jgi:membrane glycosyltransferase
MSDPRNHTFPLTPGRVNGNASDLSDRDRAASRMARHCFDTAGEFSPMANNRRVRADQSSAYKNDDDEGRLTSMPKINRVSMVPTPIDRRPWPRLWWKIWGRGKSSDINSKRGDRSAQTVTDEGGIEPGWKTVAWRRRIVLAILVLAQTVLASWSLARTFPYPSLSGLEIAIVTSFAILFSWISFSFWAAIAGFGVLWRKIKPVSTRTLRSEAHAPSLRSRTAVLIPIRNEEVDRVFAGVEASYRSLADTGQLEKFDFYILSDTNDAEKQVEEEIAWAEICQAVAGFGKIFYRHRRNNIKRKSGNIADFLRRWGRNYDYMIVFDADSVMSGETMVCLATMMDHHPRVGILQTAPTIVNRDSLFARVQQFGSRAYGPLFSASFRFWQLGESYYWGHNAILRVEPFLKHCGLVRLPGQPPFGGEILSHDFVEAALMGRSGFEVWLVYDLPGSYEESPPSLLDELTRDRRWCQGNLQHLRLLFIDGIRFGHRAIMAMGIMAYASSFFWAIFLALSTVEVAVESLIAPVYFSSSPSLFPIWPRWHPELAITLLSTTAVLLFLPKFLSLLLIAKTGEAAHFGGSLRLFVGIVLEILMSTLFAPLRMWFHGKFVLLTLLGRQIKWSVQSRDGNETSWKEAIRQHGISMTVALIWITGVFSINPSFAWWLVPVALPLALAVPLSVYSSRVSFGRALRQWGLFLVPEELFPTGVLERLHESMGWRRPNQRPHPGFIHVINDPYANAVHLALLRGKGSRSPKARARNSQLQQVAMDQGPAKLSQSDRAQLLRDAESTATLHLKVQQIRDPELAKAWGLTDRD